MNGTMLKSFLTGLILGNGYIDNGIRKRAFRIKSIRNDFVQYIKNELSFTDFSIHINNTPPYVKDNVNHQQCDELVIKAHPYFSKIYHYFYDDFRKRIISKKSLDDLQWNGWANWYMSDGYIVRVGKTKGKITGRRIELSTDRYKYADVIMLSQYLFDRYGYKVTVIKRNNVHRIRISLSDAQHFLYNISPHVVPSMMYKLDMAYDYRPKWMNDDYYLLMLNIQERQSPLLTDEEIV